MPEVKEVFRLSTQKVKPDPGALERQHMRQRRRSVGKKVGAFAVAAAIGLAAVVLVLVTRAGDNTTRPANDPSTASPAEAKAVAVATGFVEAYGAFHAEQAIAYLADDASIVGLVTSFGAEGVGDTPKDLRLLISLMEAEGYKQMLDSCDGTGSLASGIGVRCACDFHFLRSDEIGLGPFSGSYFDLTVRDGEIVQASQTWGIDEFSPQMWEPFAGWVSTAYPEDAAVMYADGTYSGARLTEESIGLWERRSREYVHVEISNMMEIAKSFMEARNAYDAEKAMSLLADDGVTVKLMSDNAMDPDMPSVRLSRDELALALEAERLYGVRYESFECRPDPDPAGVHHAQIICSYLMENRLRQTLGFPPVESSFRIGLRDDRIDYLSFPWLNVGFGPGGYHPAEGGRFVRWLQAEHPEAGGPMDPGELFRTSGQELILILTPESLDLLASYLKEYERS